MTATETGGLRTAEHRATLDAPADLLYTLVADATAATLVFPGTVHVEHVEQTAGAERIRIWAAYGEDLRTWTTHRRLRPDLRQVAFQQDDPEPPVAVMGGEWQLQPLGPDRTQVVLGHAFRAIDDDPAGTAWIEQLADRVSSGQLAALGEFAGLGAADTVRFSFVDSAGLRCGVDTAYAFVQDMPGWADTLPQVEQAAQHRVSGQMQLVDLTLAEADGTSRDTRVARVCIPDTRIAVKDLRPTAGLIAAHTAVWDFTPEPRGCTVSLRHNLALRPAAAPASLGGHPGVDALRAHARQIAGAAGRAALRRLAELG